MKWKSNIKTSNVSLCINKTNEKKFQASMWVWLFLKPFMEKHKTLCAVLHAGVKGLRDCEWEGSELTLMFISCSCVNQIVKNIWSSVRMNLVLSAWPYMTLIASQAWRDHINALKFMRISILSISRRPVFRQSPGGVSVRCKEVLLIITNLRAGGEGRDGEQMCPPKHPAVGLFYLWVLDLNGSRRQRLR